MKYVLDTNVFNRVLDGRFTLSMLPNASSFVATEIQVRELEAAHEPRRAALLATFAEMAPDLTPAAFSLDIPGAGFDEGEWDSDETVVRLREALEALKPKFNNWQDALIAGVAWKNGYGLATADVNLARVAATFDLVVYQVAT